MPLRAINFPIQHRSELNAEQNAASEFFNLAGKFFSALPPGLDESARYAYGRRSELIVASSNLVLSIELSPKALAIVTGAKVLMTHNLA
jgi:hypothetical protein